MRRADRNRRYKAHLDWIKTLPAVCCGRAPSEAAHVRIGHRLAGEHGGASLKPHDKRTVPLCHSAHVGTQHQHGERSFWDELGVDPLFIADRLWEKSGDTRAALDLLERAWAIIRGRGWRCG